MRETKVIAVRVSPDEARRAEIVARADAVSVNEVFRSALGRYLQFKRQDPEFQERARAMAARDAVIV
jgi:hypothetical protein